MITEKLRAKAKDFAQSLYQEKIDEAMSAYLKGYEDAMLSISHEIVKDGYDRFIDLLLDSGTMWSTTVHKCTKTDWEPMTYVQAKKFGMPTIEQFTELFASCELIGNQYVGKNSNAIQSVRDNMPVFCVWVESSENGGLECLAYRFEKGKAPELVRLSVKDKAYFYRVKNKKEL